MMDIETRISESLTARADRPVAVDALRVGAVARARARRRRHTVVAVVGSLALVLLVPLALRGTSAPTRVATTLPTVDVPPAEVQPGSVGTDPAILHFDVDLAALAAGGAEWISSVGYERAIILDSSRNFLSNVAIAPTEAGLVAAMGGNPTPADPPVPTTVDGRAGTLTRYVFSGVTSWEVRWQPVPGLYASAVAEDQGDAFDAAGALRLDRAQRCAVPGRPTVLPAGSSWVECQTRFDGTPAVWHSAGLTIQRPDGHRILLWWKRLTAVPPEFQADRTVAGHPAQWLTASYKGLWIPDLAGVELAIGGYKEDHPAWLTEGDAVWLAERVEVATDLDDPSDWPVS